MNQTEFALNVLDNLIKLPTVNGSEGSVAAYLKDIFQQNGIQVSLIPWHQNYNRVNLVAQYKQNDGPILGLTGHEDVVAPVAADEWTYGPFMPHHDQGKIYGRGASDMKSGLAAMALAFIRLSKDPNFHGNLRFIATVGEENGRLGAKQLTKNHFVSDLAGMIVGEPSTASSKKIMTQLLATDSFELPQAQPHNYSRQACFFAHKGTLDYQVVARGKAAHSSVPEVGINALDHLITFYNEQKRYFTHLTEFRNETLGLTKATVTMLQAGEQANTIPNLASLTAKLRTIPEYSNERIINDLKLLIANLNQANPDYHLSLRIINSDEPMQTPPTAPLVKITQASLAAIWGQPALSIGAPGGSDASEYLRANPKMPVVVVGPGNESAHAINEFVREDDYLKAINLYQLICQKYFEINNQK
ncbi:M20/M25/M40 family metallo-hydrolase [Lapidilactobacillus wuchangensis]|uniref:M20/M25/M40 family metallo-hydrolase n=1 Tax=Lapidilactobacillus wuchangensis TaxID=2486001 RepID=UPI000F7B49EA|nr:M20/M25/M40 family metallo-hydrolase [Lapidilactobacillus wuchangensis]